MADFDTRIVDKLAAEDANSQQRNNRVQKYCCYCGHVFLGDNDAEELYCKDHLGAEL